MTAHVGALHLLASAMDQLEVPRTVLRWSPHHAPAAHERNASLVGGLQRRSQALLDALAAIRAGGLVTTTLDGGNGAAAGVLLFGRRLDLGLGGFALARWTGAPLVPVVALWEDGGVVCELGAPVSDPAEATRWLEALLRRSPGQISLGLLRRLLFGPPVEPAR
jgi:lauroyl/myristoyl acyltransferase